jgi:hypothetical protein
MTDHLVATSAGPVAVPATEPVPGLHVYEIPAHVSPESPYRWILAHHEGHALASFETEKAATEAAAEVAPLADWTRNAMTTANQIGPGRTDELLSLLREAGGQHPNA